MMINIPETFEPFNIQTTLLYICLAIGTNVLLNLLQCRVSTAMVPSQLYVVLVSLYSVYYFAVCCTEVSNINTSDWHKFQLLGWVLINSSTYINVCYILHWKSLLNTIRAVEYANLIDTNLGLNLLITFVFIITHIFPMVFAYIWYVIIFSIGAVVIKGVVVKMFVENNNLLVKIFLLILINFSSTALSYILATTLYNSAVFLYAGENYIDALSDSLSYLFDSRVDLFETETIFTISKWIPL